MSGSGSFGYSSLARCVPDTHHCFAVQDLGADEVLDYTKQSVDQVYKDKPFDAVIDQIGGTHLLMAACIALQHTPVCGSCSLVCYALSQASHEQCCTELSLFDAL